MERKTFYSRLFSRKIKPDNSSGCCALDYWRYLYAEALYRVKQLEDLKCPCVNCFGDLMKTKHLLKQMENEGHIQPNKRTTNFTGAGYCEIRLPQRA
jgi:hypothetical protein